MRIHFRIYGIFDATAMYVINSYISDDIHFIRNRLGEVSTIELIEDALLQFPAKSLFKEWDEVEAFLEFELGLEEAVVDSIGDALLDVPKVILFVWFFNTVLLKNIIYYRKYADNSF